MAKEDFLTEKEAIELLRKYSNGDENAFTRVLEHSLAVKKVVEKVLKKLKPDIKVDNHLLILGAILHDIGRFSTPLKGKEKLQHGINGAKILEKEGLKKCAKIAEHHIGIGVTEQDIIDQKLPLPIKDYSPKTTEEKLLTYSDNLLKDTIEMDETWVEERFAQEIGPEYEQRTIEFHKEINKMFK
jgi:uncharacterized protein